jgi:hypothetical protein
MAPYSPPNSHYAHINLPKNVDSEQIKWIIGEHGKNLYEWTQICELKYIWMDFNNKRLELWGDYGAFAEGATSRVNSFIYNKLDEIDVNRYMRSLK